MVVLHLSDQISVIFRIMARTVLFPPGQAGAELALDSSFSAAVTPCLDR
jgi:hypothetical protein